MLSLIQNDSTEFGIELNAECGKNKIQKNKWKNIKKKWNPQKTTDANELKTVVAIE